MTATLDFTVPRADSEAFNTALYRFIEQRQGMAVYGNATIQTTAAGPVHRKVVRLDSHEELVAFARFWTDFRRSHEHPRWDVYARRFDDLPATPDLRADG